MFKKSIIFPIALFSILYGSCAFAADINNKKDWNKGWVNYDDDNKTKQESPSQAIQSLKKDNKNIIKLLNKLVEQNEENQKTQNKILKVLQKAYDPQPELIVGDDGKPCIANSSAECFKMPVVPEAQQIPVLKDWLEDPTNIQKNKKFLQWQAKFYDLKFKGGYALNLTAKQYGEEAYPIGAVTEEFITKSGDYLTDRKQQMKELLETKNKNMQIYILIGETEGFEIKYPQRIFEMYDQFKDMGIQTKIVLKDMQYKSFFETLLEMSANDNHKQDWMRIKAENGIVISPKTFEVTKPHATPYTVLKYNDKESGKKFNQVIAVGRDNPNIGFKGLYRTLLINDVIESREMHGSRASKVVAEKILDDINNAQKEKKVVEKTNEEKAEK